MYDAVVANCMGTTEFEQFRRFFHMVNNESPAARKAANKTSKTDYRPAKKLDMLIIEVNETAGILWITAKTLSGDDA
jgi:hypothetical protein